MTNALVIFNFKTGDSSCSDWKEAFLVKNFSPYDVPRIRKALEKSDAEADYYDIAVDALSHLKMDFADFEFSIKMEKSVFHVPVAEMAYALCAMMARIKTTILKILSLFLQLRSTADIESLSRRIESGSDYSHNICSSFPMAP